MTATRVSNRESLPPSSLPSSDIERTILSRTQRGQKALAPFLTAGFPDEPGFIRALRVAEDCGSDIIEVGIPFSDPIADGPTIQYASQHVLERNMTIDRALDLVAQAGISVPVVLMSYLNPLLSYGFARLVRSAVNCGVRGVIIPDLPFDPLYRDDSSNGQDPKGPSPVTSHLHGSPLDLILLSAPTTPSARLARIGRQTQGFLYAVTLTGVTGTRNQINRGTLDFLRKAKAATRRPVLAGFGIADAQSASTVAAHCDGVIVGSALITILRQTPRRTAMSRLKQFLHGLRRSLDGKNGG